MQRHVQYLTIYSQNISGGKTKINALNNNIYRSAFDIILLQETWLNHRIDTAEILANSHYNEQIGANLKTRARREVACWLSSRSALTTNSYR